jgi:hypothetical protein
LSRSSAGPSTAASPQISDSNAEPPPEKWPTTVKVRFWSDVVADPAVGRLAMRWPMITSSVPGRARPSILIAGRSASEVGSMPRTFTFELPGWPMRGIEFTTAGPRSRAAGRRARRPPPDARE